MWDVVERVFHGDKCLEVLTVDPASPVTQQIGIRKMPTPGSHEILKIRPVVPSYTRAPMPYSATMILRWRHMSNYVIHQFRTAAAFQQASMLPCLS